MRKIAVLTSGGDAPGMNAAIRAVTRAALDKGWEVVGVRQGYLGLINGNFTPLRARDVGGVQQKGGTFLGSARCKDFHKEEVQMEALRQLNSEDITGLVVIGGNGSQTGAHALSAMGYPVVGVASTIDNDLAGSDITIGVDTALNIALEAIDRLKTTASSHHRAMLVEVMGRNCGYLALMAGIAGGAEAVLLPEVPTTPEALADQFRQAYQRGKMHALAVVAEGAQYNVDALIHYFKEHKAQVGWDVRATTLGHVQRGGVPTAYDRLLATRLGAGAVDALARSENGVLVGWLKGRVGTTPLKQIVGVQKALEPDLLQLASVLAK